MNAGNPDEVMIEAGRDIHLLYPYLRMRELTGEVLNMANGFGQ